MRLWRRRPGRASSRRRSGSPLGSDGLLRRAGHPGRPRACAAWTLVKAWSNASASLHSSCRLLARIVIPLGAALGLEPRVQHTLGVQERGLWLVTEMCYERRSTLRPSCGAGRSVVAAPPLGRRRGQPGSRQRSPPGPRRSWATSRPRARRTAARRRSGSGRRDDGHDRAPAPSSRSRSASCSTARRRTGRTRRALTGRTTWRHRAAGRVSPSASPRPVPRLGVFDAERSCSCPMGRRRSAGSGRSFPTAIELLDWYHLVEIAPPGDRRRSADRLEIALSEAEPGDATAFEVLSCPAFEEAGVDLPRSDKLVAVAGYVDGQPARHRALRDRPVASSGPMEKGVDLVVARASRPVDELVPARREPAPPPAARCGSTALGPLSGRPLDRLAPFLDRLLPDRDRVGCFRPG